MDDNVKKLTNWRRVVWTLQFAVAIIALTTMSTLASAQNDAETSRIQISFLKVARGSGSGYLFYQNQKYALAIVAPEIKRIWPTSIDLIGSASNLRGASDIIGTYTAGDAAPQQSGAQRRCGSKTKKAQCLKFGQST
ncbi:MAG: hypothetical protein J2P55_01205 [Rhizobiales bacterium]|nr:hypothetical protein [Hyphomicrobiales bacterium]